MRQSKILSFFVLMLLVLLQVVTCHPRLQSLKNTVFHQGSALPADHIEGQVDFYTELEMLLQQATYLRSKLWPQSDKATMMGIRGGAECIKLRRTISIINGVTNDLQRRIESDQVCPPEEDDLLTTIQKSPIFEGSQTAPMRFLAKPLAKFSKATKIFTTRRYNVTGVAHLFHFACDNIPNTLVIIKSGQYIAGGFTQAIWQSQPSSYPRISGLPDAFFLFSVNRQRTYAYRPDRIGIETNSLLGPTFGNSPPAIRIPFDYKETKSWSNLVGNCYDFSQITGEPNEELFGQERFYIDEYEVYKLE